MGSSTIVSKHLFDLIHVDTWGPYKTPTHDGFKYFLTIVDDHIRATWTFLLSTKSNAFTVLKQFFAMVKTQFHTTVKILRSDNALELGSSKDATEFLLSEGIIHQTSCISSPQQNGVVERKHRHLLEVCRALFFQSKLPTRFWGECLLTKTFLINRFPSKLLDMKTPYELLFGHYPDYSFLRCFGCLCYASTLPIHRRKLDHKSVKCILRLSIWEERVQTS